MPPPMTSTSAIAARTASGDASDRERAGIERARRDERARPAQLGEDRVAMAVERELVAVADLVGVVVRAEHCTNLSTRYGANCAPAQRPSSAMACSGDSASRYGRGDVIAL